MDKDTFGLVIVAFFIIIACVSLVVLAGFLIYCSFEQTNAYEALCQEIDIAILGDNDIDNNDILQIKQILKEYSKFDLRFK